MTDEVQAPSSEDTAPAPTGQPDTDWQERYANLQPEYTRATQRLSQIDENLRDPDRLREFLASEYGYEFEESEQDTYDDEYVDPVDQLQARLDALENERQQERAELERLERIDRENAEVSRAIDTIADKEDVELLEEDKNLLGNLALLMRDDKGKPNVEAAYEQLYGGFLNRHKQSWVGTKKTPKVRSGAPAAQSIDLDNRETRRAYMTRKLIELEGDND